MLATVAVMIVRINWKMLSIPISSNWVLKMNMNGRIAVRAL